MAEKRIYVVNDASDDSTRLVLAISSAAALRQVMRPRYEVHVATAGEVASIMGTGGFLEKADAEVDPESLRDNVLHPAPDGNKMRVA